MRSLSWLFAVALMAGFAPVWGAGAEPTLDELLGISGDEEAESTEADSPESLEGESDESAVDPELGEAITRDDPVEAFDLAVQEMSEVTERLDAEDTGLPTQRLQQRILDRLDQVIAAASSSPPPSGGGSSSPRNADNAQNQPGQQGQQPGQRPGQAHGEPSGNQPNAGQFSPGQVGPVEPEAKSLDELRTEWGSLPPRLRDELSDGLEEPYSPVYRTVTERYYQRLAEEASQ